MTVKKLFLILALIGILAAVSVHADGSHPVGITLDGTLGTAGKLDLPGPSYQIRAEYGTQAGANLFHSFGQFNLHSGESAAFTGPDSVRNIISRVTGGNASWIDGTLASAIPNADLYFLNPSGVMFGPNASLDLGDSLHVSTADYLRLGNNERFYALAQAGELLSGAEPAAFGFLDHDIAEIAYQGKGEISEEEWNEHPGGLRLSEGKTVSLIGGNINITKGTSYSVQKTDADGNPLYVTDESGNSVPAMKSIRAGDIKSPGGRINMVSVASPGEVILTDSDADVSSFGEMGDIHISENGLADVGGTGGGSIYIRGGQFVLDDGRVRANSSGSGDGGLIDVQADELSITQGGQISCLSMDSGQGGDIKVRVKDAAALSGENAQGFVSEITAQSQSEEESAGKGGSIELSAGELRLSEGAQISTTSFGPGKGGDITVQVRDAAMFSGESSEGYASGIYAKSQGLSEPAGDSGNIELSAGELHISEGAQIVSATSGPGTGGNMKIQVREKAVLTSESPSHYSGIFASAESEESPAGNSGSIDLSAGELKISDGALITSSSWGPGQGGNITVQVREGLSLSGKDDAGEQGSGIYATTYSEEAGAGNGGTIELSAGQFYLNEGGTVSTSSYGPGDGGRIGLTGGPCRFEDGAIISTSGRGSGDAGEIHLDVSSLELKDASVSSESTAAEHGGKAGIITVQAEDSVRLLENGSLTTEAESSGGGKIFVNAGNQIYLFKGTITGSVKQGEGNGGDVTADSEFVLLNQSHVTANAEEGDGGAIFIRTNSYIPSFGSNVSATSKRGNDGTVKIEAPDTDISKGLTFLPGNYLDVSRWLKTPCSARAGEKISRFVIKGRDAVPTAIDDWLPAPGLWSDSRDSEHKRLESEPY